MIYAFIDAHRSAFAVKKMCQVLQVSRSGYYAWRGRPESAQAYATRALMQRIQAIFAAQHGRYGSPRVTAVLQDEGLQVSRSWVARLMQRAGLQAITPRAGHRTTRPDPTQPVAPNLLQQHFTAAAPGQRWVSDLTYLRTDEGWAFLTAILDLYHRKVVGWTLSADLTTEQTTRPALEQAWRREQPAPGVLVHSDRGSQYSAAAFRTQLERYHMVQSMSGTGNCYDNAVAESFFKTLKTELVSTAHFQTRAEAFHHLFEYIEVYYNRQRKHSSLGYQSPEAFLQAQQTKAA